MLVRSCGELVARPLGARKNEGGVHLNIQSSRVGLHECRCGAKVGARFSLARAVFAARFLLTRGSRELARGCAPHGGPGVETPGRGSGGSQPPERSEKGGRSPPDHGLVVVVCLGLKLGMYIQCSAPSGVVYLQDQCSFSFSSHPLRVMVNESSE